MHGASPGSWTIGLGCWRGVEVRVHILFPLAALVAFLAASWPVGHPFAAAPLTSGTAALGMGILLASVVLHEAAKALAAHRMGGRTPLVILGPWGSGAQPHLPADPPAHLVTAIAGPLTYLAIAVTSACLLVLLVGDRNLVDLVRPFDPDFVRRDTAFHFGLQLAVWINSWLLLANLLPVAPLDGAEVLKGLLWPLVGRASTAAASSHIAYGAAAMTAVLAVVLQQQMITRDGRDLMPVWFPLSLASVFLLYGGSRAARQGSYDAGLDIDELESDDEQWLAVDWLEEERAAVVAERLQEKQRETLDRKRREREDREDARVDDILARVQEVGLDHLSEDEQAILKRASRRYRQRLERNQES